MVVLKINFIIKHKTQQENKVQGNNFATFYMIYGYGSPFIPPLNKKIKKVIASFCLTILTLLQTCNSEG